MRTEDNIDKGIRNLLLIEEISTKKKLQATSCLRGRESNPTSKP